MDKSLIYFGFSKLDSIETSSFQTVSTFMPEIIDDIIKDIEKGLKQSTFHKYGYARPLEFIVYKIPSMDKIAVIGSFVYVCNDAESYRLLKLLNIDKLKDDMGLFEFVYRDSRDLIAATESQKDGIVEIKYEDHIRNDTNGYNKFYNYNTKKCGKTLQSVRKQ